MERTKAQNFLLATHMAVMFNLRIGSIHACLQKGIFMKYTLPGGDTNNKCIEEPFINHQQI